MFCISYHILEHSCVSCRVQESTVLSKEHCTFRATLALALATHGGHHAHAAFALYK